jgi:cyclic pyranopterin phosphate synthase
VAESNFKIEITGVAFEEGAKMKGLGGSIAYRYSPRLNTLFLNITNRCSNSCSFCVKNSNPGLSGYKLWLDREPIDREIWIAFEDEVKKTDREVVWCGFGEPTTRLGTVLSLTNRITQEYPNLRVRLDTDGLAGLRNAGRNVARELSEAGIYYVSISLNAENQEKYELLCKPSMPGSYQAVLDFARNCRKHISQVRLTVVNLESIDINKCRDIAEDLGCDFEVRG